MKKLLLLLPLLALFWQPAQAQAPLYGFCVQSTSTECNSPTVNPGTGRQGDQLFQFGYKYNTNFHFLSPIWVLPANTLLGNPTGSLGGLNYIVLGTNLSMTGNVLNAAGGGGGGGTPGGSSGQIQFNNAGSFGGFTPTQDCGINVSTGVVTCLRTNNVLFGPLATLTPGTGVATALGLNIGSAGAPVLFNGALGTPSSGIGTNLTGTASGLNIGGTAANLSGTPALPNGTTATTQTVGDNTTKLATDAFVLANASSSSSITPGTTTVVGATAPCLLDNSTGTTMGCAAIASTLALNGGALGTSVPSRTVTTSPTFAAGDMGGAIFSNVSGGGTATIPAISSTVFASGMGSTLVNYSASTEAVSTTPTINAGGGCVSGSGIPAGATWELVSNGTSIDCNQTVAKVAIGQVTGLGTGVGTALGNAVSTAGGPALTIAAGTAALGTSAITSGSCATVVTVSASGVATTDTIISTPNGDPTAITGYAPSTSGILTIYPYPTANNVNYKVCNSTASSVTPGALTLNFRVVR